MPVPKPTRLPCSRSTTVATFGALCVIGLFGFAANSRPTWALGHSPGKGTLWVFAVGVSHYRNSMIDLQYADNDAEKLAEALRNRAAGVFANVDTKVLLNEQVNRQSLVDGLKSFFAQAGPHDTGVIALMGHGVISNGVSYFLPYPADATNLESEGLPISDFDAAVQGVNVKVKKLVLMLDTCHADAFSPQMRGLNASGRPNTRARGISLVNEVADKVPDTFVLGSSQGDESSWEDASYRLPEEKQGHGAFTYALLRGLDGEAPAYDGIFYVEELSAYVSHQVYEVTHGRQTPTLNSAHGANFPIARAIEPPSPANAQQAASLLQQGEQAKRKGQLPQARKALARAEQLDPKNQVAGVLNDEVSADIS